jgi:hypothetical protein
MLELRPDCECCGKDLPPESSEAMICSFECTFCRACVEAKLLNVCPNCGGGFEARPVRPSREHRKGAYLGNRPASTVRKHRAIDLDGHFEFAHSLKETPPHRR